MISVIVAGIITVIVIAVVVIADTEAASCHTVHVDLDVD